MTSSGKQSFKFIDLFAGIGGMRLGFESAGGTCVWSSEWNKYSNQTYESNFGDGGILEGDITKVDETSLPAFDVLLAGFPCQPFSIAGVSKKNALGRLHGFDDETQGTLFFDIERILKATKPAAFLLENVKNLRSHDKGRTFEVITRHLRALGYHVPEPRVIDARHFVPQHRERVFIAGFREPVEWSLDTLALPPMDLAPRLGHILHKTDGSEPFIPHDGHRFFDFDGRVVLPKYTLTPKLWAYLQAYKEKHQKAGNGFGFGIFGQGDVARTLSARYHKDGSEVLIDQGPGKVPRRLTPRECARLMGFPDSFEIPVSDTQAYRQFGNAVAVPVINAVAGHMLSALQLTNKAKRSSTGKQRRGALSLAA